MRWVSLSDMTLVPRRFLICSLDRLIIPWRLRVWPCLILPVAVKRKRFFALDFVFSLGISLSCAERPQERAPGCVLNRLGMPCRRSVPKGGGFIRETMGFARRGPVGHEPSP